MATASPPAVVKDPPELEEIESEVLAIDNPPESVKAPTVGEELAVVKEEFKIPLNVDICVDLLISKIFAVFEEFLNLKRVEELSNSPLADPITFLKNTLLLLALNIILSPEDDQVAEDNVIDVAVAFPIFGVINVGLVCNTELPVPVKGTEITFLEPSV